jgi:hypothetical protein
MSEQAQAAEAPELTAENAADAFVDAFEAGLQELEGEAPKAPKAPKEAPSEEAEKEAEDESEPSETSEAESPKAVALEDVRKLLKGRKLEEAAKLLGVELADLGIDQREHRALRKAAQRAERAQEALAATRGELDQERAKVKQANEHFGTIAERYRAGDYSGAIEALFGADLNRVQQLIEEQHSDPTRREILRMRREIEETKRQQEERQKAAEAEQLTKAQEAQVSAYLNDVAEKLPKVAPKYAPLAEDRRFLRAVFDKQAEHYRNEGEHLPLGRAIKETAEEIRQRLSPWRSLLTEGEPSTSGGGSQASARRAQTSPKTVSRSQGGASKSAPLSWENAAEAWSSATSDI